MGAGGWAGDPAAAQNKLAFAPAPRLVGAEKAGAAPTPLAGRAAPLRRPRNAHWPFRALCGRVAGVAERELGGNRGAGKGKVGGSVRCSSGRFRLLEGLGVGQRLSRRPLWRSLCLTKHAHFLFSITITTAGLHAPAATPPSALTAAELRRLKKRATNRESARRMRALRKTQWDELMREVREGGGSVGGGGKRRFLCF